jgi:hypothetical protein
LTTKAKISPLTIEFYHVNEILRRFFLPYISQKNGVSKKKNKCLCNEEDVLNMLLSIVLMGVFEA